MKKIKFLFSVLMLLFAFLAITLSSPLFSQDADSLKVGDYTIEKSLPIDKGNLVLNGAGIRVKFFMDIYVGGLYLKAKSSDSSTILNSDEPCAITMKIVSDKLTSEKIKEAFEDGMKRATNDKMDAYKEQTDKLFLVFQDKAQKGDIFTFLYTPGVGLQGFKNKKLSQTIAGKDFRKVFFSIWLGDNPPDPSLKSKLLGQ